MAEEMEDQQPVATETAASNKPIPRGTRYQVQPGDKFLTIHKRIKPAIALPALKNANKHLQRPSGSGKYDKIYAFKDWVTVPK